MFVAAEDYGLLVLIAPHSLVLGAHSVYSSLLHQLPLIFMPKQSHSHSVYSGDYSDPSLLLFFPLISGAGLKKEFNLLESDCKLSMKVMVDKVCRPHLNLSGMMTASRMSVS